MEIVSVSATWLFDPAGGLWYFYAKPMQRPCLMPVAKEMPNMMGILVFRSREMAERYRQEIIKGDSLAPGRFPLRKVEFSHLEAWLRSSQQWASFLIWPNFREKAVRHQGVATETVLEMFEAMKRDKNKG